MSVVRALDVGFGATKFVVQRIPGQPPVCRKFPSLAPLASDANLSGGYLQRRETMMVEINGRRYEVGPDVEGALPTYYSRVLNPNYTESPQYLALARGAMTMMSVSHIDRLILGLPVESLGAKRAALEARFVGVHPTANGGRVMVRSVATFAQPVGGLIAYIVENNAAQLAKGQLNLVIDPGYFTYDFVVTNGVSPIEARSGSVNGGVSAVLQHIARQVSKQIHERYDNLLSIERALETGCPLVVFGREEPLDRYIDPNTLAPIDEAVDLMINKIGTGGDIKSILLVGGGARLYLPAIRRRLPRHPVHLVDNPEFANVRGFQYAGEELARRSAEMVA